MENQELPLDREDVAAILETLFDIRSNTDRILAILEYDDGEEEEEEADPDA
jgi:hypothetical protein